jgi:tetratricopeptide (TPR) repeat protein
LAAANWSSGDVDGAADALAPIVRRADADSWSLQMAARVAADQGRKGDADILLRRALALKPGNAASFASADSYGVVAGTAARDPLNPMVVIPAIRAQLAGGNSGAAMAGALRLQEANRGVADAHVLVGDVAMATRDWKGAVRAFREARRISASEAVGLRLANAQHWSGDPAGAGATVVQLLEANPSGMSANRIAGHLYVDIGRWDDAIRYFERVRVRGGNRDLVLLRELARAWMAKGNPREAGRYAALAYRLQPASLSATVQYAEILAELGATAKARDLYEKAAAMDPGNKQWEKRLDALTN